MNQHNNIIKMKSKKAIVLPETLKLVIAVMCILILIYFAVQIYSLMHVKTGLEQARAHLDKIVEISDNLGEEQSKEYILLSPKGWTLIQWPYKNEQIDNCAANEGEFCLCFCKYKYRSLAAYRLDTGISPSEEAYTKQVKDACNEMSVCKIIKNKDIIVNSNYLSEEKYFIELNGILEAKSPLIITFKEGKLYFNLNI